MTSPPRNTTPRTTTTNNASNRLHGNPRQPTRHAPASCRRRAYEGNDAQRTHDPHAAGVTPGTGISLADLHRIGDAFQRFPTGFSVHPKLGKLLAARHDMSRNGGIDWAFAELAAFGSLLLDKVPVRISGQDTRRGTFAQRHAVLHDQRSGRQWNPLQHLGDGQAPFGVYDSLLSEYAVAGFEYGYSVGHPEALVLWETQFGDFINGAQVVVDEFIASAEQKWGQSSSITLLLPHGYEGRGPTTPRDALNAFCNCAPKTT